MKIHYYLTRMKNRATYPIVVSVSWDGFRIIKSIGISIKENQFDSEREKVKRNFSNEKEINNFLDRLKQNIQDFYFSKKAVNENISKGEMTTFVQTYLKPIETSKKQDSSSITSIISGVIEKIKDSPQFKQSTIKKYITHQNYITDYQRTKNKINSISEIDYNYVKSYAFFLSKRKNLQDASIHKSLKIFSTFLNKAYEYSIIDNLNHKLIFTKVLKELNLNTESQKFALNQEEIYKIINYQPISIRLQKTRDLFLFQILTGMRYSDLKNIRRERVYLENMVIKFKQEKTNNEVTIPIIKLTLDILERYNFSLPIISATQYNKSIKLLCNELNINEQTEKVWKSLNKKVVKIVKKSDVITNHFGRVTFAVEALRGGALDREVMSATGHRDPKTFDKYKKIAKQESTENVRNALLSRYDK